MLIEVLYSFHVAPWICWAIAVACSMSPKSAQGRMLPKYDSLLHFQFFFNNRHRTATVSSFTTVIMIKGIYIYILQHADNEITN